MVSSIIFLGAPGCGKGTQASVVQKKLNYLHVSTGDLLRKIVSEESEIGNKLKAILASGALVSDEMVNTIIDDFYSKNSKAEGVILDGYPRNVEQAILLESILKKFDSKITKVFYFEINEEIVIKRITGRYTCSQCNTVYNKYFNTTKMANECDVCHAHEFDQRSDDTEEVVRNRLKIFHESTQPLLEYYKDKLVKINADQSLGEVSAEILENL